MTKIVVVEVDKGKLKVEPIYYGLNRMMEGACNADGSWKKGWQLPGQSYVRLNSSGHYTVVHNLNRIDYSVSASLINSIGTVEIENLTDVSFDIKISLNNEPANIAFRFAINFTAKKDA